MKKQQNPAKPRTQEMADKLVEWISEGKTLLEFCRQHEGFKKSAYYAWMAEDQDFAGRFARARVIGMDVIAEECLTIANTPLMGVETTVKSGGVETKTGDMLGHRKLQIETRLKLLAKWDPKRFGERLEVEAGGDLAAAIMAGRRRARKSDLDE